MIESYLKSHLRNKGELLSESVAHYFSIRIYICVALTKFSIYIFCVDSRPNILQKFMDGSERVHRGYQYIRCQDPPMRRAQVAAFLGL